MDLKRVAVLAAIGLVIGGAVFGAILLLAPGQSEPKKLSPAELKASPLTPVPAELLKPRAIGPVTPVPFIGTPTSTVKSFATLREGEQVTQLAFTPDGNFLVAIDYSDSHIRVWNWRAGKVVSKAKHVHLLTSFAVAPDGKGVWTGDAYQNLYFWTLADGRLGTGSRIGSDLGGHVYVAISPNGRVVATVSYEKVLTLWDAAARKELAKITTDEQLRRVVFSPDGKRLVVGTATNLLLEYQLASGEGRKVQIMPVKPDIDLMTMAFSTDGKRFSTGHTQPWLTVWEGESMTYRHWLKCPMSAVCELTYSRDGTMIAFAQGNSEVHLWNPDIAAESGSIAVLKEHEKGIRSLAFSPEGKTLASGDESGTIRLWASAE